MERAEDKTITLYLMDGKPTGRVKCYVQKSNYVAFKISRSDLELCKDREELKQAGIYFLFSDSNNNIKDTCVYIGKASSRSNGEGLLYRLQEHKRNPEKDYWNEAIAITSKDKSLGETELCYLENYFCKLAKEADRYVVKNGNTPPCGNISEEEISSINRFIEEVELIMGVLNYKVFVPLTDNIEKDNCKNIFYLKRQKRKSGITITAKCQKTKDGFVVLKGSYINPEEMKGCYKKISQMRKTARIDENNILQEDVHFNSPSYAAAFVLGSTSNGLIDWKTEDGIPLKQFESEE